MCKIEQIRFTAGLCPQFPECPNAELLVVCWAAELYGNPPIVRCTDNGRYCVNRQAPYMNDCPMGTVF